MVKVLEVFIREGDSITSDKDSGTNTAIIYVLDDYSRRVNVVTQKNQKNWPSVCFLGAWLNQARPIACGLLAACFGATTLEIVDA
jgi:hypothetical protein